MERWWMHAIESGTITLAQHLFNTVGWLGIVLAMAIESACVPLPSEVIMPLAGWLLVADRHLGWPGIIEASMWGAVGNIVGSTIAYAVGAWGGRPLLARYGKWLLITPNDLALADRWFGRWGELTVFFTRLLPVVRTFISLPAGVARMPYWRFIAFSAVGAFLWCIPLTAIGYSLGPRWDQLRQSTRWLDYPFAALIVLLIVWYVWHKVHALRAASPKVTEMD